jgi:signal peptidase
MMILVIIMTVIIVDGYANHRIVSVLPAVILSDSMYPALRAGDLIFLRIVENTDKITKGNIITFKSDDIFITHRVLRIMKTDEFVAFETKGDANTTKDKRLVSTKDVTGVCYTRVPYLGYLIQFIRTPVGMLLFIVLPLGMLIREIIQRIEG